MLLTRLLNLGADPERLTSSMQRRVRLANAFALLFIGLFLVALVFNSIFLRKFAILVAQSILLVVGGTALWLNHRKRERAATYFLSSITPLLILAVTVVVRLINEYPDEFMLVMQRKIVTAILLFLPVLLIPYENTWRWRLSFLPGLVAFFGQDLSVLYLSGDALRQEWFNNQMFLLNVTLLVPITLVVSGTLYLLRLNDKNEARITGLLASEAEKNRQLDQAHSEIMDSIQYARRIQTAILPEKNYLADYLAEHAVFYRPKDVVSGDFYWFAHLEKHNLSVFAAVDCTGHGVPGAFMSVIGYNLLNRIVLELEITEPDVVLTELDRQVRLALKQNEQNANTHDGMDMGLCVYNHESRQLDYAGAGRPIFIYRKGGLWEFKGDKYPVGGAQNPDKFFTKKSFYLSPGDRAYLYSDGFTDQFGGPRKRKFSPKRMRSLLLEIQDVPMREQERQIAAAFDRWKGGLEQLDDVTLVAFEAA